MSLHNRRFTCMTLFLMFATLSCGLAAEAQQYDAKLMEGMKYRLVGPYRGGRSLTAVGVPSDPNTYYFGAVSGGIWKSVNGGNTWTPLFEKQSVSSIGSIAVADSDPNVVYAGTGEACIRGNISYGDGVYKSTDAGKTWTNVGLQDTRHIGRVIIHPRNADIVYVAALGHAYGANTERGVFRTTDGGKHWEKVFYLNDKTGAIDITFVPSNPHILFAAMWEAGRTPWSLTSGGPGSGLYKSVDSGTTWKKIEGNGWPSGVLGRIGVSVSGDNPERVYVILEAADEVGGMYRSDDGGQHWTQTTSDHRLRHRPWYYTHVTADPRNADTVYVMNTSLYLSIDGGKTWTPIGNLPHGDHHGLWIDPNNSKHMVNANDGGATITVDGGNTWTRQDTQPTAQFYHVSTDDEFPYHLFGAQQDNSTIRIVSRSNRGIIGAPEWEAVGGGEAGYVTMDPTDPNIVYAGDYWGILTRHDRRTGQSQNVQVWPDDADGHYASELKYRFNWTEPIYISKHDPKKLYYAGNVLFLSTDAGKHWTPISPDLTRNDKSKQGFSGGPITGENISVEYYDVIFTFAESPMQKDLLWAGTDDGLVQISRDGGKNWSNVTPKELPEWSMISILDASPHDPASAYIAVDRHKWDDARAYIYKTHDYGKTWTRINAGIPDGAYVHAVREDPARKGLLFAGTEIGIFVSFDDGARWQPLQLNLPTTPIHDLMVKGDDLAVATHGRSFWILDDISPLRQMSDEIARADAHLFHPAMAYRHRPERSRPGPSDASNPPEGTILDYYLRADQKQEITLEILDGQQKVIRKYSSIEKKVEGKPLPERPESRDAPPAQLPVSAGMHRFVWDLRYDMPELVPSSVWDMGAPVAPMAVPGNYVARLTVEGKSYTAPIEVKLDPRVKTPPKDLDEQLALHLKVRELFGSLHRTVLDMRSLRGQVTALRKRFATSGDANGKAIADAATEIDRKMSPVEAALFEVRAVSSQDMCNFPTTLNNKIAWLNNSVDSADAAPTQAEYDFFAEKQKEVAAQLSAWREIVSRDVAALNDLMRRENIPALQVVVREVVP